MPIAGVGGFTGEPALSLCNDTLQELCAQPFNWKFNSRESSQMFTQAARQEYIFAGASAFTKQYGVGIDLSINSAITESANTVTVNTLQLHNFSVGDTVYMTGNDVAAYNSTLSQGPTASGWSGGWTITSTPTSTSFQFTHATSGLAVSGAPGIYHFAWLETSVMVDTQSIEAAPKEWPLDAVRSLKLTGTAGTRYWLLGTRYSYW
ncbi:MAG: hypothetical protein ACXVZV_02830 [Terriglobales bacterium]